MLGVRSATVTEGRQTGAGGLAELYERNVPRAIRLAYLITSDPDLSQDIAQEAFARVVGRFAHLRAPERVDVYLRRTVVNLCNSHFRHQRVVRAALIREAATASTTDTGQPDIGLRDELRAALHRLPVRQRTAIVLHYYEDMSEDQLAEAMRCSPAAARSLVSHGMATLRTLIGGEDR